MPDKITFDIIARIHSDFGTKFGVPRQSGLVENLQACIVFEPEYRVPEALRGIEDFSHIWIIWQFSETVRKNWTPTVRPPRLGGNKRIGVFATRSPYRPNEIGLSCVKLEKIEHTSKYGDVLWVSGADLMDNTPILDLKPYLQYTDCKTNVRSGFTDGLSVHKLTVDISKELLGDFPENKIQGLVEVLEQDPRPRYQNDSNRVYGMDFTGFNVKFQVDNNTLTVLEVIKKDLSD